MLVIREGEDSQSVPVLKKGLFILFWHLVHFFELYSSSALVCEVPRGV